MCIQCVFNVHSMYIQCTFNVHSMYIHLKTFHFGTSTPDVPYPDVPYPDVA